MKLIKTYPISLTIYYASGRVENMQVHKDWPEYKKDLDGMQAEGAVTRYTYALAHEAAARRVLGRAGVA